MHGPDPRRTPVREELAVDPQARWHVRAASALDARRVQAIRGAVAGLAFAVRVLDVPLLVVALVPLPSLLLLALLALVAGGVSGGILAAVAALGALPSLAVAWQRRAMRRAVRDPDDLAGALVRTFDAADAWAQAEGTLDAVAGVVRGPAGPWARARRGWRAARMVGALVARFTEVEQLAAFAPWRLTWSAYAAVSALAAAVVAGLLDAVVAVALLAGAA